MIAVETTIGALLSKGEAALAPVGFDNPRVEAEALLSGIVGVGRTELYLRRAELVDGSRAAQFDAAIERRRKREPVAYILGEAAFAGFEFHVDARVLIPRPETELLIEEAAALVAQYRWEAPTILDIGTGSGCIAVTLAKRFPKARIVAVDLSSEALVVANDNARRHNVADRIRFFLSDIYAGLLREHRGDFDIIVTNPPYVSTSEMQSLETDLAYEPRPALDGGQEGLSVVDRIVAGAPEWLRPSGALLLEIGSAQGLVVAERLSDRAFLNVSIKPDLNGHHRIVMGVLGGPV